MLRVLLLLSVVTCALGHEDEFFQKYTYAKTMSQCFGNSAYHEYILRISEAKRECSGTPYAFPPYNPSPYPTNFPVYPTRNPIYTTSNPRYTTKRPFYTTSNPRYTTKRPFFTRITSAPVNVGMPNRPLPSSGGFQTYPNYNSGNQQLFSGFDPLKMDFLPSSNRPKSYHQQKLYDSVAINTAIEKVSNALRNFTCVLSRLGLIDQSLNINYDMIVNNYYSSPIDGQLRADLLTGVNYCRQLTMCIPEDKSPISYELQRVMAFIKCEKRIRLSACFKQDLRNNIHHFDISALPNDGDRTTDLEKLMTILIGPESLDQLELY